MNRYTCMANAHTREAELRNVNVITPHEFKKGDVIKVDGLGHTIKFITKLEDIRPKFGDVIVETKPTTKTTK